MPPPRPLTLIAELSYRCPLRCPYCSNPLDIGAAAYRDELESEHWIRAFGEAAALGVLQLALTGGEPMLRRDLPQLCEAAREAGLYSSLITAGTLFDDARAVELKRAGLDHVQISIQSPDPADNDRIAGNRSFAKKLAAAQIAKQSGVPADDQLRPAPPEPRPDRADPGAGARPWRAAVGARQYPVLRLGGPQPGGADADSGATRARRGRGQPVPRAGRPQARHSLGAARLLRGSAETLHGWLGAHGARDRPQRGRAPVPGGEHDPRAARSPTCASTRSTGSGTNQTRSRASAAPTGCRSRAAAARWTVRSRISAAVAVRRCV